jgi:putative ABC transport system substrate-binding protein
LTGSAGAFEETFLRALRELGYIEGRNLVMEYRWAEGKVERLPALAAELVSLKVDMIVTSGVPSAKAAKAATSSIPVVMATSADAVSDGLVASFAHPGANVTGMSLFSRELSGKRLEIVKETIPGITRVAVLFNSLNPSNPPQSKETEAAAERLGLQAVPLSIHFPDGVEPAFAEAARTGARAVLVVSDSATITHRTHLGAAGLKYRLPTMFTNKAYLEGGGLMSYGPDIFEVYRHAAAYVDKILKGAKPADLPVEQPTKFELVINLKTAKALGLTIPPSVLARADQVIE